MDNIIFYNRYNPLNQWARDLGTLQILVGYGPDKPVGSLLLYLNHIKGRSAYRTWNLSQTFRAYTRKFSCNGMTTLQDYTRIPNSKATSAEVAFGHMRGPDVAFGHMRGPTSAEVAFGHMRGPIARFLYQPAFKIRAIYF